MEPYKNKDITEWKAITEKLVESHPLRPEIVGICLNSWKSILAGFINDKLCLTIGEMKISPQAIGALLHDIIPEYIQKNKIKGFRKGTGGEKDIVSDINENDSVELKTSSQKCIYGNRSYTKSEGGKSKSGFYLAVNFDKMTDNDSPRIQLIRFGWLDYEDWIGQKSESGQQARLRPEAKENKLITFYDAFKNDVLGVIEKSSAELNNSEIAKQLDSTAQKVSGYTKLLLAEGLIERIVMKRKDYWK